MLGLLAAAMFAQSVLAIFGLVGALLVSTRDLLPHPPSDSTARS